MPTTHRDDSAGKTAAIFAVSNSLEHNATIVYRSIFLGESHSLISNSPGWTAQCHDEKMDGLSLGEMITIFSRKPNLALFWADVHQSAEVLSLARRLKKVSPSTTTLVFGRATTFIPQYFERDPFDFVHVDGDREATIQDVITYIDGHIERGQVHGASINEDGKFRRTRGRRLPPDLWPFPSLSILPIENYKKYTSDVHGPRYSHRISVTVAKGCTWNCAYCGATQEEGLADRRRDVGSIFDWVEAAAVDTYGCLLHLYAPDLFYDRPWMKQFVEEYGRRSSKFGWRGVTTTKTLLDRDLIVECGASGCQELAMGVEHINSQKDRGLKSSLSEIEAAADNCHAAGISLKALVMLGYPGQTKDDVDYMSQVLTSFGMTVRFTGYTPLQTLRLLKQSELDGLSIDHYDRRTFFDPGKSKLSPEFFYKTITTDDGYVHA